jgi:tRNA-dihydrouridine synthase
MQHRLILAPLMGITGATFRRTYNRHFPGFTGALAPFITTTQGKPAACSHFKDILPENNKDSLPLVPQLIGRSGPDFACAAERLCDDFGFTEVNWNIGCPSGTVTAKKRGAGILPYPDLIDAFLDHVCRTVSCRLSIKMRLGLNDPMEFKALVPIFNRYPIAEITMHPRTGSQMYEGSVDIHAFEGFYATCEKPIVYNGDITSVACAQSLVEKFPKLSGLMIGRGALSNPLLPAAIISGKDETALFDRARLKAFHDDLFQRYEAMLEGGAPVVLGRMKELWAYWKHIAGNPKKIKTILKAKRFDEYQSGVESVFDDET